MLAAGTGAQPRLTLWPLCNPVSRYLGDVSYSLYLWHFPLVIFGLAYSPRRRCGCTGCWCWASTLGLSALSYHLLEDPVRRSLWLEPPRSGARC